MKLIFSGAAREVTGSCHFIEACGRKFMIDCGMEQGEDQYENQQIDTIPSDIDWVLLSHAHIDHSGNLPLMAKMGFKGRIISTTATAKLCSIMLRDSAHIQMFEAEWKNRKAKRASDDQIQPLYDMNDAEAAIELFETVEYGQMVELCPGISIRYTDAGHLLGSSIIEIFITENGISRKVVYTGDLGNLNQPLINDPSKVDEADYLIMESTYGNRLHDTPIDVPTALSEIIQRAFDRGGNVVIPSFAVGRTQEILYYIRIIKERGLVKRHGNFPVYVDSPLAIEATTIYGPDCVAFYDDEAKSLVRNGVNPISFPNLRTSVTSNDSKQINFDLEPKVIISASGMCEAGRIRHHLKHNLWRSECIVLFVGYQANGTLGRILVDGINKVKLFGEEVAVKAEIAILPGTSSHADKAGLLDFVSSFTKKPRGVFVVHGNEDACLDMVESLKEMGVSAAAPFTGEVRSLLDGSMLKEGTIKHKEVKPSVSTPVKKRNPVFAKLQKTASRLLAIIAKCEGGANKELRNFENELDTLCNKYDRQ